MMIWNTDRCKSCIELDNVVKNWCEIFPSWLPFDFCPSLLIKAPNENVLWRIWFICTRKKLKVINYLYLQEFDRSYPCDLGTYNFLFTFCKINTHLALPAVPMPHRNPGPFLLHMCIYQCPIQLYQILSKNYPWNFGTLSGPHDNLFFGHLFSSKSVEKNKIFIVHKKK